jgi:hypothetical protein
MNIIYVLIGAACLKIIFGADYKTLCLVLIGCASVLCVKKVSLVICQMHREEKRIRNNLNKAKTKLQTARDADKNYLTGYIKGLEQRFLNGPKITITSNSNRDKIQGYYDGLDGKSVDGLFAYTDAHNCRSFTEASKGIEFRNYIASDRR